MRDLGYPEPNWYPIPQGDPYAPAIVANALKQVWGSINPYTAGGPLCKWSESSENNGRGSCKTDISYIHSALGFAKELFDDPVVNYILRFHLEAACYRSTQYSKNDAAQYCAIWYFDPYTKTKMNTTQTCYDITYPTTNYQGEPITRKIGCAHKAHLGGAAVPAPASALPFADALATPVVAGDGATTDLPGAAAPEAETHAAPPPNQRRLAQTSSAPAPSPVPASTPPVAAEALEPSEDTLDKDTPDDQEEEEDGDKPAESPDAATPSEAGEAPEPELAIASGSPISTLAQFLSNINPTFTNGIYSAQGLEFFPSREAWYNCHKTTVAGTISRETCYSEAFGQNFGLNAVALQSMLRIIWSDGVDCAGNFATNGGSQGEVSNQDWCEKNTSNWLVDNVLPVWNITGSPAQPQSLEPTITSPPPPPPPPVPTPIFPPPPPTPLAGLRAAQDVLGEPNATNNEVVEDNSGASTFHRFLTALTLLWGALLIT